MVNKAPKGVGVEQKYLGWGRPKNVDMISMSASVLFSRRTDKSVVLHLKLFGPVFHFMCSFNESDLT